MFDHRAITALMAGIAPIIREHVAKEIGDISVRVGALEKREPQKGDKGEPGERGERGEAGPVGDAGAAGPAGQDGIAGVAGKDGAPGAKGEPGPAGPIGAAGAAGINGKDGAPGRDGLPGVAGAAGRDGIDGKDGAPGKDGFSLNDFAMTTDDDGRTIRLKFQDVGGFTLEREIKTGVVLDRGVWRAGLFVRGDGVTWGGSFWIAQRDTSAKPDTPDSGWRMAVKRGRDGKDGKDGKPGMEGKQGARGEPGPRGYGG